MYILAACRKIVIVLLGRRYRPELHYMRGPGPRWFERHGRSLVQAQSLSVPSSGGEISELMQTRAPQSPN
jgi:hypothetical protein